MDNISRRHAELKESALRALCNSAQLCKQFSNEDDLPDNLEQLEKLAWKYSELDLKFKHYEKNIAATETFFNNPENAKHKISVEEKYNEINDKNPLILEERLLTTHPIMIQYSKSIDEIDVEKETYVDENEEFRPPTDPVTKQPIRNPVKNPQCGHIYEYDSITELISVRKNTRCPYIGCPALQYIQINNLVPDKQLKRKIDNYNLNH